MEPTHSFETLLAEADRFLAEGDKSKALARFQAAVDLDPKSLRAWQGVADTTGDCDEQVKALGQVVALDPGNVAVRDRLLSLQVSDLRSHLDTNERAYRGNLLRRAARPFLILASLVALVAVVVYFGLDPATQWVSQLTMVRDTPTPWPTLQALALPPTWTPTPLPTATPTPPIITGRINGIVTSRAGPGVLFVSAGMLNWPTTVVLVARDPEGQYYQVHRSDDPTLSWVTVESVSITNGDPATLPVVNIPAPTGTPTPTLKATPTRRPIVQQPTTAPVYLFQMIKYQPNPYGPQCDRTLIQGTVWDRGYGQGFAPGSLVAVWVGGNLYKTDVAGSHSGSYPASQGNRAYWEVHLPRQQAVKGYVGIVGANGGLLSRQYYFELTGGDCRNGNSVNEIIIDFSH